MTQNAFCEQLKQSGKEFDISKMMVVDLLHEFELGVWKALFTHLIRILHAASERPGALVDVLNTRYVCSTNRGACSHDPSRFRQVPTFGQFTIRCFHNNVSEMKRLAARDFEDILQATLIPPCGIVQITDALFDH